MAELSDDIALLERVADIDCGRGNRGHDFLRCPVCRVGFALGRIVDTCQEALDYAREKGLVERGAGKE